MHILTATAVIVSICLISIAGVLQVAQDLFVGVDPGFDYSDDEQALAETALGDLAPPASAAGRMQSR